MSSQRLIRNLRKAADQCDLHPGDQVFMINCPEAQKHLGVVWTVDSLPWEMCGRVVVMPKGYHGCFDAEKLGRVKN